MQAYCVKCRAKKEMKDAKAITMKNGNPGRLSDLWHKNVQNWQSLGLLDIDDERRDILISGYPASLVTR